MDKNHLDFSDILFTESTTAFVNNEEEFSWEDIQITKRYLFLVKLRIESRRKDFMRKLRAMKEREELREDMAAMNICAEDYYFDHYLDWSRHITDELLLKHLAQLPVNQQKILWGVYVCRDTQKHLSEQLSVSPVAVHKAMQRALKRLRKELQ
ncbi:hypothetical protein NHG31_08250 [Aerococcaceae bacterium NML171108]|nr:hypothetical protein [Aerococcaceae bacterium NML171108]